MIVLFVAAGLYLLVGIVIFIVGICRLVKTILMRGDEP